MGQKLSLSTILDLILDRMVSFVYDSTTYYQFSAAEKYRNVILCQKVLVFWEKGV